MGWCYTKFARDQRSQLNTDILHNLFFGMEVLERCLPIFNHISEVLISNTDLRDRNSQSFRIKDSRKCFFVESFKRVSVLHKKYFQLHKWSFFFFRPQNTGTFSVFASAEFRKIKDHSLETKEFRTLNLH